MAENFDVKLDNKTYIPNPSYQANSALGDYKKAYAEFLSDPDGFWAGKARELDWIKPWDKVKEWNWPNARWFCGGKLNISANCLDRHVKNGRRNKLALIWKGEQKKEEIYTYRQLYRAVMRFANALKKLGVQKGDRICLYMPLVPEHIIAMLACARIGAVHSIVYAGFGAEALHARIRDAQAKIVITADVGVRRGKLIPLRSIVDDAVKNSPSVEKIVVLSRERCPVELYSEMEVDFYAIQEGVSEECPPEEMDSEDPLFILYTSGTTGQPKGIVHTTGGYLVGAHYTCKYIFDLKENDVHWCTADPGWITGHSYIVYGPLSVGATVLITETTPDYPDPGIWWSLIEEFGVTVFYTAPTAIRMFMKVGEQWPDKYNLSSLRIIGSVGEPLNPEAFEWYYRVIGRNRCPILDTWWQTETGMHMITTPIGQPMKPGFAGVPIPGVVADVVDKEGNPVPARQGGLLVIKEPWPSMMRTVYNNPDRYKQYWNQIKNWYTVGDLAVKDEDGYIMVLGRSDDIIIVAGHNLGTAEVESALVSHEAVAEAAVIGVPDDVKGQAVKAFVILRQGYEPSQKLVSELTYHVRMTIGPIAMPSGIEFMDKLPKTRSGKIMRRVLKAKEMGVDPGDISTLEE
ncbi:acetate--CoA ligase [Methanospirillum hungatei]|uniref:acetate--CoA ligase n=1 Tax=Methanospirillum hungatei TaxID=2203 RepID=UPI0009CB1257|nr:acetate--CoA ligase [Methanospirillum hungatei]MBP9008876.1 acetate--CoA ligase [Methanospirillum sp.]OQA59358.1 MAG: Acetyl-coenzyme A synthetase [Euryarchaeota archaeon ADurb.Bin294]HOW05646.1 acetate--CoA ligase [Methanospirillum hungatei]